MDNESIDYMNDNIDYMNDNIDELDFSWIQEFEKLDNEYKLYYTEDISFIKIHIVYINTNNEIEKIREEKIILKTQGILCKEELLRIIKNNSFSNQNKYSLLSILKYNINIEPIHLKTFLRNKNPAIGAPFLQSIKHIDTIKFEKSISMFHDINELIIIFHKKIHKPTHSEINNNRTKKVFINSNPKKRTKRKELKDTA
jgi:Txe/YoeB family toxin of Txe-Axe toxin-antitoxin module